MELTNQSGGVIFLATADVGRGWRQVFGLVKATWGRAELRENELQITIELPAIRNERLSRSGLPSILLYQPPIEIDRRDRVGFWFSLLIVLAERSSREYPNILEWDTQFVMAGRPRPAVDIRDLYT